MISKITIQLILTH